MSSSQGCHAMLAAMHLSLGLESAGPMNELLNTSIGSGRSDAQWCDVMLVLELCHCPHLDVESRAHYSTSSYELRHHSSHGVNPNGKPHTCKGTFISHPAIPWPVKRRAEQSPEALLHSMA